MFFASGSHRIWIVGLAGLAALCAGCGEQRSVDTDAMRTVPPGPSPALPEPTPVTTTKTSSGGEAQKAPEAKQPAAAAASTPVAPQPAAGDSRDKNLIENGSFERWAPRERVPWPWKHGYGYATVDEMPSIARMCKEDVPDGGYALEQTWNRSDAKDSVFQRFGITIESLKPNTSYRFTVKVKNESKGTVLVSPYSITSGEKPEAVENLKLGLVEIVPGEGFQSLKGYFQTKNETSVRIAAACVEGEFPVTVVWDDWRLAELGPAEESGVHGGEKP